MNTICPKCQAAIPEANVNLQTGIALCASCGEVFSIMVVNPLPEAAMPHSAGRFCVKCGAKLSEGLPFCTKCGAPVGAVQAVSPQPQPAPLPNPTVAAQTRYEGAQANVNYISVGDHEKPDVGSLTMQQIAKNQKQHTNESINQIQSFPTPQPVPKKKRTLRIVLIAIAGVILLALVIMFQPFPTYSVRTIDGGNAVEITKYRGYSTEVQIPSRIRNLPVTRIGDRAFHGYESWPLQRRFRQLTSVTIPNSVTQIGNYAFFVNKLTSVTIPDSITFIGAYAFAHNELTSVTIPNGVTKIHIGAFFRNQLTSVIIPNGVTTIEMWAFTGNRLTSVSVPRGTDVSDQAFGSDVTVTRR